MSRKKLSITERPSDYDEFHNPRRAEKNRGSYAAHITNMNPPVDEARQQYRGPPMKINLLWQAMTIKHSPCIKEEFELPDPYPLATAQNWVAYPGESSIIFPMHAFNPKVQHQNEVDPKTLPKGVAIERRRREYEQNDIVSLLIGRGIRLADLVPIHILFHEITAKSKRYGLSKWIHFLPLEIFDDEGYDSMTPQDWIIHGLVNGVRYPLPGVAFLPNLTWREKDRGILSLDKIYEWTEVAVLDYDPNDNLWFVISLEGKKRRFYIPKLYLLMAAENPVNFADRIEAALNLRDKTERIIRCEFIVDCMNLTGTLTMSDELFAKVINLVLSTKVGKSMYYSDYFAKIKEEILVNHKRTMGELEFRRIQSESDPAYRVCSKESMIIQVDHEPIVSIVGKEEFDKKKKYFSWYTIYVLPETYRAMSYVVGECLKVAQMSLFSASYGNRYVSLDEFNNIQIQTLNIVIKHLKTTWLETLVFNIRMCIGDLGKGWFDINESYFEVYEVAKLNRFMELVKYRMQYTLRLLVENSMQIFINMVETPCLPCLPVSDDMEWGDDLINSPFISGAPPIFGMQLKMEDTGPYYSTQPQLFHETLLRIFDDAIAQSHQVRQVHPLLLQNLRFPADLCLSSVGLLSEEVSSIRNRFLLAYEKALIPLLAYAKKYETHINLYTMNIHDYIESYEIDNKTAAEVKEDISQHCRMKRSLEETLPNVIFIGPFHISIETLRSFLINKRQEIINRMLDLFAAKMKRVVEELLHEYKTIMNKLAVKPTSIEHILDIRDWMETVPLTVRSLDETCKRYTLEYEVLDHFWYALDNEDFANKWEAIGWPLKISKQIDETSKYLVEEEEKFFKLQIDDEFVLNDKIDTLTAQIVNMSGYKDITRTNEYALEIRKVWKVLKDAQEFGQLLNQRQKLFGATVVPFENLNKLIKEFEPYKNLWCTASDWLRLHEMCMDNPIVNVDADAIEQQVTDIFKMMIRLTRIFADIEKVQNVAIEIKNQIDTFRPLIPLLQSLRNPGMRQRHWEGLSAETGIDLDMKETTTFKDMLALGIESVANEIKRVAETAGKEYTIEQTLQKMINEWDENLLDIQAYKETVEYLDENQNRRYSFNNVDVLTNILCCHPQDTSVDCPLLNVRLRLIQGKLSIQEQIQSKRTAQLSK